MVTTERVGAAVGTVMLQLAARGHCLQLLLTTQDFRNGDV